MADYECSVYFSSKEAALNQNNLVTYVDRINARWFPDDPMSLNERAKFPMTVAESMAGMSGVFHFLTSDTESSLFRNDLVRMTRDDRGNFVESEGVSTEPFELSVNNAEGFPDRNR